MFGLNRENARGQMDVSRRSFDKNLCSSQSTVVMALRGEVGPWFGCLTYVGKNGKYVEDVFCKISGKVSFVGGGVRPHGVLFQRQG